MKLLTLIIALGIAGTATADNKSARTDSIINFDWHFHAGDVNNGESTELSDASWRTLSLPHDFQIEQPWETPSADERPDNSDPGANRRSLLSSRGFKKMGIGWYRKSFSPPAAWEGRRVLLDFEGILLVGDAWLNGTPIGKTDYGYLGFEADITKLLRFGQENVIAVRADTRSATSSRWYTGAGLYRDVHLVTTDPQLYFTRHPLYITTTDNNKVSITAEIHCQERNVKNIPISVRIFDREGKVIAEKKTQLKFRGNQKTCEYQLPDMHVQNAHLWNLEDPYLYKAEVTIYHQDGSEADRVESNFGVRTIEYGPDFGFKLNGKKIILKGIANHHTLGALGAAAYPRAIEKRVKLLKEFGFNHIRTSHNPYSDDLLNLCDQYGILVVDELYDKWLKQYAGDRIPWTELWQHDIPEWIKRDRNHPSVVMWSLGNELQTYWNIPYADWGVTTYRIQKPLLQRYDQTRPITVAMHPRGRNIETDSLPAPLVMETDISAYNYRYMYFPGDGRRFPWMKFYQSEATTAAMGPNYFEMDLNKVIGLAYWGAIDYLGESQGWPAKGWAQGVFNIDLSTKPNAYLAKSIFSEEPVVHICVLEQSQDIEWNGVKQKIRRLTDHWTRTKGEKLSITTYTNADEIELIVNGKSLGKKKNEVTNPKVRNQIRWDKVEYKDGYIEAIARNGGKVVARHRVETAGKASKLVLQPDLPKLGNNIKDNSLVWHADGRDLQHVVVTATDKKGRVVPSADSDITFSVDGPAEIIAVSSGDHYSDELTFTNHRRLYDGSCLVILRAGRTPGAVTLTATGQGIKSTRLVMATK
ncbi:MAG: DUF4982 domain-containing protein [Bacteroidaceae bacterium]|nr:DUF4982 domain-containing protein [Bacteroidaceae bacterium]